MSYIFNPCTSSTYKSAQGCLIYNPKTLANKCPISNTWIYPKSDTRITQCLPTLYTIPWYWKYYFTGSHSLTKPNTSSYYNISASFQPSHLPKSSRYLLPLYLPYGETSPTPLQDILPTFDTLAALVIFQYIDPSHSPLQSSYLKHSKLQDSTQPIL